MRPYTEEELNALFTRFIDEFGLKGEYVKYVCINSGNINDTYVIRTEVDGRLKNYLAQRINTNAFAEPEKIADNVVKVTEFIRQKLIEQHSYDVKRKALHYFRKANGAFYAIDNDSYWRVVSYINDSVTHDIADPDILYHTGAAFGEFQKLLSDFPLERLYDTIKDFHNTKKRYEALKAAAAEDKCGRLSSVKEEYDYLLSMEKEAFVICDLYESGAIPERVTHNDTKCNNVMFDALTGEHLAVIDLDTVMPGLVAYDFGDAVRFAANPAGEDCEDVSKVHLDLDYYSAFASGFLPYVLGTLNDAEIASLPDGVLSITLELAARFLTDYLSGDVYFKCKKPMHNLIRTRAQIALAKDICSKLGAMRDRISCITSKI